MGTEDRIELRIFQQSWLAAVNTAVRSGRRIVVGNIHPGSGKTLANLHALNWLFRQGHIDAAQIWVPRINLCQQFELDWKDLSLLYADPKMPSIAHRSEEPLLRDGAFGYVSTYTALLAAEHDRGGNRHERFLRSHRTAIVLDEAHQLGIGSEGDDATVSAAVIQRLAPLATMVFVVSGTHRRGDGRRVILARYTEPDAKGAIYLDADVESTYKQGVTQGFLRPFEFQLCDGHAIHQYFDGEMEDLQLSRMKSGLYRVLESADFWRPMVDLWVRRVREYQQIDPSLCGLIGALSQAGAQSIIRYVNEKYPDFRILLAVSDERLAHDNLRLFKEGGYDGLVTVAMCHVGYDHKPICVVLALNDVREESWLDQFFARALRECGRRLTMLALVPDDVPMATYCARKREESREGIIEREKQERSASAERQAPRLGITSDVQMGARRAQGLEEDTELSPSQLAMIESLKGDYGLHTAPSTGLARLLRAKGVRLETAMTPPPAPSQKTQREIEKEVSEKIEKVTRRCDTLMEESGAVWARGYANADLKRQFGKERKQMSYTELVRALAWLEETYYPLIRRRAGQEEAE